LSKRIGKRPWSTSKAQKASGQRVICEPRPLISSTASLFASPNVSYSMAIAPDFALAMPLSRAVSAVARIMGAGARSWQACRKVSGGDIVPPRSSAIHAPGRN
jgi:hypothetical protein